MTRTIVFALALCLLPALARAEETRGYDLILRGGTIYDGSGGKPYVGDVAVNGDRIAAIGSLGQAKGKKEIDARGLAVSPGFVNMLSWATESLLVDGRAQSDIRQGVTLEVMGEGDSMGPLNDAMKKEAIAQQGDVKYPITWTTLGEYLDHVASRGIAPNVASFVGATTLRVHEVGYANRPPNPEELARMRKLADQAMEEGALGVGSSLIYAPAFYAGTDELVALCEEAAKFGGMYISHMRSEGNRLLEAMDELIDISRRAKLPAEIYHFKAAGQPNEVADSSLLHDRKRKSSLYARADVPDYWMMNVVDWCLEVYRDPRAGAYRSHIVLRAGDVISRKYKSQMSMGYRTSSIQIEWAHTLACDNKSQNRQSPEK